MTYETPKLPYEYNALEPYIDEKTMRIHHDKHHAAYTQKFNAALVQHPELLGKEAEEIIANVDSLPESIRSSVRNNGGGHVNHAFFWEIMRVGKEDNKPNGSIAQSIEKTFGSFEEFKNKFSQAALTQFGSGWAWLVVNNSELEILSTSNQDSPLSKGKTPLLNLDVWEHAYYLKYENRRPEYVENFFAVVNWDKVNELFEATKN